MKNPPDWRRARDTPVQVRQNAEAIAVSALEFLTEDGERLTRFLALAGLGPDNLRAAAAGPGFLPSVLDHVLQDEKLLLAFAAARDLAPETVAEARRAWDREAANRP